MHQRERAHVALMTPAQAAAALRVAPRTVARWAAEGKLTSVRTPGGHRRYLVIDVQARAASAARR